MTTTTQLVHSKPDPLNREPSPKELIAKFITEGTEDGAYDRNHGNIPQINGDTHTVRVQGSVRTPLSLSVAQLKNDFSQHELVCALQCAGNRRHTMRTRLKEVDGIDWFDGAVMNCRWRGPLLKDVLEKAGVNVPDTNKAHVAFACYQTETEKDSWYGASVELWRALKADAEIILALEMNNKPLTPKHGYPVRVVVPGVAGARSVKWLDRITIQDHESDNFYHQMDYKILPADITTPEEARAHLKSTPALQDMPINSVVAVPYSGDTVTLSRRGDIEVRGYALPAGTQGPVVKVEVSADGGKSWTDAEIIRDRHQSKWCWALYRAKVKIERGTNKLILSRATDAGGNVQVEKPEWNIRGVAYNGYGEARDVTVV
ncbi:sulfite oxidase [Xylona heveae TC161]|uniref:Sulfite oxidase n=1 Tax=Xylona heveae (strain CBS 132557 / TC161) TaxID=1328760 RepID=A0A165ABA7_XYLHT|nr:sulfite oxidase [Xylona heveae TC161]KZF20204.1 sulfite oxidase [Xylona heveae TC161]